jgi:hypothetical protein
MGNEGLREKIALEIARAWIHPMTRKGNTTEAIWLCCEKRRMLELADAALAIPEIAEALELRRVYADTLCGTGIVRITAVDPADVYIKPTEA